MSILFESILFSYGICTNISSNWRVTKLIQQTLRCHKRIIIWKNIVYSAITASQSRLILNI